MPKLAEKSAELEFAKKLLQTVKSFGPDFELEDGFTLEMMQAVVDELQASLDDYLQSMDELDKAENDLRESERELEGLGVRLLAAVAEKYGQDSREYALVSLKPTSKRRRPGRRKNSGGASS